MSALAHIARATPFHPQWLIRGERSAFAQLMRYSSGLVLDIGCGDRWAESSLPKGCTYIGLDSLDMGRDRYGSRPTVFADASRLPLAPGSVDTILLVEVLEHLAEPEKVLAEAHACLSPRGRLLATMPFLYPVHDAPADFQRLTEHGIRRSLERAGFEVEYLAPRLGALQTAALNACLAMGGVARSTLARPGLAWLLLPVWALLVPVVNVVAKILSWMAPDWNAMTNGYLFAARKVGGTRRSVGAV